MFSVFDTIHVHLRSNLLEDGDLIDITETAAEAGFKIHTAMTRTAWFKCVAWDSSKKANSGQDERGRLWDVVSMAYLAACGAQNAATDRIEFKVMCVPADGTTSRAVETTLTLHVGGGDHGEPVLTIMLPGED